MAIKIGNTTVINNDKQLVFGDGSNSGAGTYRFTASGSITAGDPVVLTTNPAPTVSKVTSSSNTSYTANISGNTSAAGAYPAVAADPNTGRVLYAYVDYSTADGLAQGLKLRAASISGSTTTTGTSVRLSAIGYGGIGAQVVACDPATGVFIICYGTYTSPNSTYWLIAARISSGNTITLGTPLSLGSASGEGSYLAINAIAFASDSNTFVGTAGGSYSGTDKAKLFTYNPTTLAITYVVTNDSISPGWQVYAPSLIRVGSKYISFATAGWPAAWGVYTVSGSTLTLANSASISQMTSNGGTDSAFDGWHQGASFYDAASNKILSFYYIYNSTSGSYSHWCAIFSWNDSTNTLSLLNRVAVVQAVSSLASFSKNPYANQYAIFFKGSSAGSYFTSQYIVTANFDSASNTLNQSTPLEWGDRVVNANSLKSAYDYGSGQYACAWYSNYSGSTSYARSTNFQLNSDYDRFLGIATTSASNGSTVEVALPGSWATPSSTNLLAGAKYYLDSAGAITNTTTPVLIGRALAYNRILIG